jgi:hypothetical protein
LNINRFLIKINRISGWVLLVFITVYMVSGYAWTNRIIMPTTQARYLHSTLDIYMMPIFLAHVLISTKFALKRWGLRHDRLVNLALILAGAISYALVLMIR